VLLLSCVCVSVSGVLFSVGMCVCDLCLFEQVGEEAELRCAQP